MKKSAFIRLAATLSALLCLVFCACGASGSGGGTASSGGDGVLRIAISQDFATMDAHLTTNDYTVPMNTFDALFNVKKNADGSTEIVKSLAEDFSVSEDGRTYSFTLREGVVFSDGTPLTADDVKFTFERILTIPGGAQTDFVIAIRGAQALLDGTATELTGIEVQDDLHFTITLEEPFAAFLAQLATPSTVIYSRKIVTEAGEDFGVVPAKTIGTGPYKVTEWNRGASIIFEYNDLYWGEEPSVKRVEIRVMDASTMDMAFQKGDIDILDCLYLDGMIVESNYKSGSRQYSIVTADRLGNNFLMLNEKIEPMHDVRVRKALQMAIDRQSILDSVYNGDGQLEDGVYPSGCLGYSTENQGWLSYDPESAKALLAEAGYADGFTMEISLDSGSTDAVKNAVQIMAENLKAVGVTADIVSYDHASWLDKRNSGDMPAFIGLWILDFNDPDNVIYTFFGSKDNTVTRSNNYADADTIARVGAARAIVDTDERMKEYAALEKKLVQEDAVWVPLYSLKHLFVTGERIASFVPHWAGWSDVYFAEVTLK